MKRNKVLSLVLAVVLVFSLGVPALAASSDDAALQAVTLKVKNVLDLDTDIYTEFNGWPSENVLTGTRWTLDWSGDGVQLTIVADDNGKIYSYSKSESVSDDEIVPYSSGRFNIPSLPKGDAQQSCDAAQAFLDKVLDPDVESVELEPDTYPSLRRTSFRFGGTVLLNGLPSPISCSLTVRASDNQVMNFWRNDQRSGYQGTLPGPETSITDNQARITLRDSVSMEAFYVLQADGKTAKVTYLPKYGDQYYVDGQTGKLVNLTELQNSLWASSSSNKYLQEAEAEAPMAADAAVNTSAVLNPTELAGAAKLEGVMDKEELDKAIQNAWPEIGLKDYTLAGANYWLVKKPAQEGEEPEYDVSCRLTYGKKLKESTANKYVTVDAKTGKLLSLYSYRPWEEDTSIAVPAGTAEGAARHILEIFAGANFKQVKLFDTQEASKGNAQYRFTFCQSANDYFYRDNQYTVGVDAVDGTISSLIGSFDEEIVLEKPSKVITPFQATVAYIEAMDLWYGYLEVPCAIDLMGAEIYQRLKDSIYSYVVTLKTGFTLTQPKDGYISGVDAATGEPVKSVNTPSANDTLSYDDVEGTWVAEAANALAAFNVGFPGGSLNSTAKLTQLDLMILLTSVDGYRIDPTTPEEIDYLYQHCYYLRLVTPETRDEDKIVTRAELVKLILDGAGYQRVAGLQGIFTCSFTDADAIPADHYGYAALAQGLGLVRGDEKGNYAALRDATRGEAIAMLYQYMK